MHSKIFLYEITCPECGTKHIGFVGDNEDGSFYCGAKVIVKKGNKEFTEKCEYSREKLHHMPDGSIKKLATIKIKDSKVEVEYS